MVSDYQTLRFDEMLINEIAQETSLAEDVEPGEVEEAEKKSESTPDRK